MTLNEALRLLQSEEYKSATAVRKQEMLWTAVEGTRYQRLPPPNNSVVIQLLRQLNLPSRNKAFTTIEDARGSRTKPCFPYGVVAKIEFIPEGQHQFTGLFRAPSIGIARLGVNMNPDKYYITGIAVKLLVDGLPSQNLLMGPSLDPQTTRNFFQHAQTNSMPRPTRIPFGPFWGVGSKMLTLITPTPLTQPLEHLASVTPTGERVAEWRAPYQIFSVAPEEVRQNFDTTEDFRESLARIAPGTIIYRIDAKAAQDADQVPIGHIRTSSEIIVSEFADRMLFFRHMRAGSPQSSGG